MALVEIKTRLPRSTDRGPIEAAEERPKLFRRGRLPRSTDRGPIEASDLGVFQKSLVIAFHDQLIVAPLKLLYGERQDHERYAFHDQLIVAPLKP